MKKRLMILLKHLMVCFAFSCGIGACDWGALLSDDDQPKTELEKLPAMTQTGENTFGCLVNGKAFVVTNAYDQVAFYQGGGIFIAGEKDVKGQSSHLSILVGESSIGEKIAEGNTYILNSDSSPKGEYYTESQDCFYYTTSTSTGKIEIIHFDTVNYIVSGKFAFQAVADGCVDSIKVTDGRFDVHYVP